jgi:hypothetical protein
MMIPKKRLISGMVGVAVRRHADRVMRAPVAENLGFLESRVADVVCRELART